MVQKNRALSTFSKKLDVSEDSCQVNKNRLQAGCGLVKNIYQDYTFMGQPSKNTLTQIEH